MNDEEIRIGDLLITIVKRWKTVLVLTLLGFGFGFVLNSVSFVKGTYTSYEITCSIAITAQGTNGNFANGGGQLTSGDFQLAEDEMARLAVVDTVSPHDREAERPRPGGNGHDQVENRRQNPPPGRNLPAAGESPGNQAILRRQIGG